MSEEIKKIELSEEDLEAVSGGANGEPHDWRCRYCGVVKTVSVVEDVIGHYAVCPKKPK